MEERRYIVLDKGSDSNKQSNPVTTFFAIVGVIAVIVGIGYAIYRFLTPEYLNDLDDNFDDDFEDYFQDEEDSADGIDIEPEI